MSGTGPQMFPAGQPAAPVEAVLITRELACRPARPADHAAENAALAGLLAELASPSARLLEKLVETALTLCRADSAGISLLEEEDGKAVIRCHAVTGRWASFRGGAVPRSTALCGLVLARNQTLLVTHPERHFPGVPAAAPPVAEALLVPFHAADEPVGTLWVFAHDESRRFDTEDERLLTRLSHVASTAYGLQTLRESLRGEVAARRRSAAELREARAVPEEREAARPWELSEHHALLALAMETTQAGWGTWDWSTGEARWSATGKQILGFHTEEEAGTTAGWLRRVHPEDRPKLEAAAAWDPAHPRDFHLEYRVVHPDGDIRHVYGASRMLGPAGGSPSRCTGMVFDITPRKRAELERNRFFDLSVDVLGIAALDSWRWKRVNPAFQRILGWTADELEREPLTELVHPEDRARLQAALAGLAAGEPLNGFAHRLRCRDGGYRWIAWNAVPYVAEGVVYSVGRDVTDATAAEETLQQSEARLRLALEVSRMGTWELDLDSLQARCSARHDEIFGYTGTRPAWSYDRFLEHLRPEDRPVVDREFREAVAEGRDYEFECRIRRPDGEIRWVAALGRCCRDADGRPTRMLGVVWDITERRRLLAELESLARHRQAVMREAHHRIKNNLQTVADLLSIEEGTLREPVARRALRESIHRVLTIALVHDLLSADATPENVDTRAMAERLLPVVLQGAYPTPAELELVLEVESLLLPSRRITSLALVLNELVGNAVKHGFRNRDRGRLEVRLWREADHVHLRVADDGHGLPPGFSRGTHAHVGLKVVEVLVEEDLDGTFTLAGHGGARAEVDFPMPMDN